MQWPVCWFFMPHPLTRKMVVKPCMKIKSKRWWCCVLHQLHFCVVFTPKNNWQHQTVKYVLILQFDIHGSVHHDVLTKMTNKMQLCRIIYCSLTALHVSSDTYAHHQEHHSCIYSFWYYSHMWLPAGVMDELELLFQLIQGSSRQSHMWIIPEAVNTAVMLLMMSESIARNM